MIGTVLSFLTNFSFTWKATTMIILKFQRQSTKHPYKSEISPLHIDFKMCPWNSKLHYAQLPSQIQNFDHGNFWKSACEIEKNPMPNLKITMLRGHFSNLFVGISILIVVFRQLKLKKQRLIENLVLKGARSHSSPVFWVGVEIKFVCSANF